MDIHHSSGKSTAKTVIIILLIGVLIGVSTVAVLMYRQNKEFEQKLIVKSDEMNELHQKYKKLEADYKGLGTNLPDNKNEAIVLKISRLRTLPKDEQATIATIEDPRLLGNQPFFAKAKVGDYLLVYNKAKIAFLYREEIDEIVNEGPISFQRAPEAEQTGQPQL